MQVLHGLLAAAAAFVVLRWAPWGRQTAALFVLGYFPFYEYAVISRHYVLGALLVWLACAVARTRWSVAVGGAALGLLCQTRSVEADVRPLKGHHGASKFASTGFVSATASEYWGSNQAALAVAVWKTTRRVHVLDARYNVPIHVLAGEAGWSEEWRDIRPVHVHYHWMLYAEHRSRALDVLTRLGVPSDRLAWIAARTPLDDGHVVWR
jgi:hypothetical protein